MRPFFLLVAVLLIPFAAYSDEAKPTPRVINVTADSAPGWMPSVELEEAARAAALGYLEAKDTGRLQDAYAFFTDLEKQYESLDAFVKRAGAFNATAGAVKERRILVLTWTKDPHDAPVPGIYAAFDLVSRFANIERHCGFLILYQAPSGGAFQVMREEENVLDNATAAAIEQKQGRAALDTLWAQLSGNCPNYPGFVPQP